MGVADLKQQKAHAAAVFRRIVRETPAAIVLGALSSLAASLLRLGFRGLQWCLTHNGVSPPVAAASLPPVQRFLGR